MRNTGRLYELIAVLSMQDKRGGGHSSELPKIFGSGCVSKTCLYGQFGRVRGSTAPNVCLPRHMHTLHSSIKWNCRKSSSQGERRNDSKSSAEWSLGQMEAQGNDGILLLAERARHRS